MGKILKKMFKRNKPATIIFFIVSILYIIGFIYFSYNIINLTGIETLIRYVGLILLLGYFVLYVLLSLINIIKRQHLKNVILNIISLLLICIFFASSYLMGYMYGFLDKLGISDKTLYTSYLITLKDTDFGENSLIGRIDNTDDVEGYTLASKIIVNEKLENKVSNYSDYYLLIQDLYDGVIDAAFVQGNYISYFSSEEAFADINSATKVVYTYSEEAKNEDADLVSDKDFSEPISFLIMGVDSRTDGLNANAAFNGDTLMLITFNPKTLNVTMFSIPRDTYVPITCKKNNKYKINSSAAYGTSCVIDTVEAFTGINIDYYVKINFKGVVDLVDALGGVTVDVATPNYNYDSEHAGMVCEQNSDRSFGDNLVCINPGVQTLNGEQALAYSRCRHLYSASDLARIKHQQDVVMAMAQKVSKIRSLTEFENVLNAVTKNISTNMSKEQMLSAYSVIKKLMSGENSTGITISKSYLETYNLNVYLPGSKRYTAALGYYKDSLNEIVTAMKVNLEMEEPTLTKTFTFSANKEYQTKVYGEGIRTGSTDSILPNFVGQTKDYTNDWCSKNSISCSFEYVDSDSEYFNNDYQKDYVTYQSSHSGELMDTISSLKFYVNKTNGVKKVETEQDSTSDSDTDKSTDTKQDEE